MFRKLILMSATIVLLLGGLTACEKEGPMERAGERIDEAAKEATGN